MPGGIGLTAWLNQVYSQLGCEVIGGADGMFSGLNAETKKYDTKTWAYQTEGQQPSTQPTGPGTLWTPSDR